VHLQVGFKSSDPGTVHRRGGSARGCSSFGDPLLRVDRAAAEPERISGRRRYPAEVVRTLSIIGAAQRAGLSLDDVRELLASSDANGGVSERLRTIARRRLPEIDALIERAGLVRGWLEAAADCRCPTLEDCPLFDELD
jgi:MerR, DNA binding